MLITPYEQDIHPPPMSFGKICVAIIFGCVVAPFAIIAALLSDGEH